ncbi:hypothetical protein ONA91_17200 [Micromonospora sp. DR5-3]|uniref:hypothetical protein n=1 Tax=unclassified Micromonospora TaxID=2617518 RepID=UPI0011D52A95|nr:MULTISPECIES: hypothetical protein [unclassified Micromonospora]MCW3816183.1 hypothetical protein [Micromonospora sp. DR5-3]TYC19169.1 hypothetical protein FXF52_38110 [Micromonospora sp. MP36]
MAVGPAAAAIGTRDTLLILAALVVLSVLGMLTSRDVRRLQARAPLGAAAAVPDPPAHQGPGDAPAIAPAEPLR